MQPLRALANIIYGFDKMEKAHPGELKCIDVLRIAKWMWIVMENKTTSSI